MSSTIFFNESFRKNGFLWVIYLRYSIVILHRETYLYVLWSLLFLILFIGICEYVKINKKEIINIVKINEESSPFQTPFGKRDFGNLEKKGRTVIITMVILLSLLLFLLSLFIFATKYRLRCCLWYREIGCWYRFDG